MISEMLSTKISIKEKEIIEKFICAIPRRHSQVTRCKNILIIMKNARSSSRGEEQEENFFLLSITFTMGFYPKRYTFNFFLFSRAQKILVWYITQARRDLFIMLRHKFTRNFSYLLSICQLPVSFYHSTFSFHFRRCIFMCSVETEP